MPYTAAQVVELLGAVGCDVDAERQPARGHAAVLAPRPDRPGRPGRGGRPARRLRRRPVACCRRRRPGRGLTDVQRRRRSVGRTLAEAGYVEAPSYPFVGTAALDALGLPEDDPRRQVVVVRNPLSEEEPALRTTLLPGLLATLARNLSRGQRDLALFEHGAVFPGGERTPAPLPGVDRRPDDATLAALLGAVPEQPWHVAVALRGQPRAARLVGCRAARRPGPTPCRPPGSSPPPRASSSPCGRGSRRRGTPAAAPSCSSATASSATPASCTRGSARRWSCRPRTSVMELDVDALPPAAGAGRAADLGFPPVLLDLALVVPDDVPAAEVEAALREGAGELLESLRLFDVYTGAAGAGRPPVAGVRADAAGAGPDAHQRGGAPPCGDAAVAAAAATDGSRTACLS